MTVRQNVSLKEFNTFGIDVSARYFAAFRSVNELQELLQSHGAEAPGYTSTFNLQPSTLILGGGSNILFTKDVDGLVLKNELKGIEKIKEDDLYVYVKVAAGENWHQFVMYCINESLAGVENLSLIPGNTGASPMQNIGAYGVEIKDVFHELEAFHLQEKKIIRFSNSDCGFGYRESVFKRKLKGQFVITSVTFRLNKVPVYNIEYGAIKQELDKMNIQTLSIKAVSDAVIRIRSSKLPDPKITGNAGSFFKNPEISVEKFETLKAAHPGIVGYLLENGQVKLAAGWLIEQCGWKGYRKGDAGCHAMQALVLVNYGNASGNEIYSLSEEILQSVAEKFGVMLEREVNVV